MKDFIYVAGLFRSGTTLVQEMLTEKGKSFIFHEPRFGDGWWQFEGLDRSYLRTWDVELPKFESIGNLFQWFEGQGIQIGAKEIRNKGGCNYYNMFAGKLRLVVVDRDPYYIYLSCYNMMLRNNDKFTWSPQYAPLSAINVFRELLPEVKNINAIWELCHPERKMVVHYGDIVANPSNITKMYELCKSEVTTPDIGGYHRILPRGEYETKKHGNAITTKSLGSVDTPAHIIEDAVKLRNLINKEKAWN